MIVHIVGAGPTGFSIAWEILKYTDNDVILYDKKPGVGGSWYEPDEHVRDLHSHRAVFKNAFVNTRNLFEEMSIDWNDIFKKKNSQDVYGSLLKNFGFKDYVALISLFLKVITQPEIYRYKSLSETMTSMSVKGQRIMETLTYIMDGVSWNVMTAYEFVQNFNHVALSSPETQKVSGKVMNDEIQEALMARGCKMRFEKTLVDVEYGHDSFKATFDDGEIIEDGLLVLALDPNASLKFLKNNWGDEAYDKIISGSYECINLLLDYENHIDLGNTFELSLKSKWKIIPDVLSDGKTVSCVICKLNDEVLTTPPEALKNEVLNQLNLPEPQHYRFGWGAEWVDPRWILSQSSGVLSTKGQVPFFGKSNAVALCGMMSHRYTPYASIEAAIEVGRTFCHSVFDTRKPYTPILLSDALKFILVFILILIIFTRE